MAKGWPKGKPRGYQRNPENENPRCGHKVAPGRARAGLCATCHMRMLRHRLLGITPEKYQELFAEQRGRCAICDLPSDISLAVDHDHATGKIRGLLCKKHNVGLAFFQDNPEYLHAAARYLSKE